MLARWLECGLDPARVTVYRPSGKSVADGVAVLDAWPEYLPDGTLVLLGMKPYQIDDVAPHVAGMKGQDIRLVSILAGISTAALRSRFPGHADIVRVMPNTPVGVGQRSEEHTSELQSLMRISYAVFCLKKKNIINILA